MKQKYPATRRENIVEEIHGVKIEDPYRWLEDATLNHSKKLLIYGLYRLFFVHITQD